MGKTLVGRPRASSSAPSSRPPRRARASDGRAGTAKKPATSRESRIHPYLFWLDLPDQDTPTLIEQVKRGLPFETFEMFSETMGVEATRLAAMLSFPSSTFARRKESGHLNAAQSEQLVRLSRVFDLCTELFGGDLEKARRWLTSPREALGGKTPLAMASTEIGAREVEDLIGRIRHGVFS